MNKLVRVLIGGLLLLGLLYVRFRESELFYDPLIDYFHGDYQNKTLPELAQGKFFLNVLLRYFINMLLSLGILWAVFTDRSILKFTSIFYLIVLVILLSPFYYLLHHHNPSEYLPLFYVRRFLIQPLLIFLLLPAFFYYRKVDK
ncbi:exosortase F system-associated protein [uncultured Dokdonia sp.]|uniref:exosortase F system-associated membrane protein n=1 Tax=uncultured Dokdonia sp. TaxID=575653 RepID=UPI0030EBC9E2